MTSMQDNFMKNKNVQSQLQILDFKLHCIQKMLATVHLKVSVVSSEGEACPSEEALNHIVWNSALSDSVEVECNANTLIVKV